MISTNQFLESLKLHIGAYRAPRRRGVRLGPYGRSVPKKYREVREALREAGWDVLRQRGSHEVWGRPGEPVRIVVAGKDSQTVPVGTLSSIRKASGLEHLR
jgi:predicted RNA binding protein YcfA (HicA-like mRNA interferase family)